MNEGKTRWEKTKTPGLYVRRPGGTFYSRITIGGKRTFRSLDTTKPREAEKLHRELKSGHTRSVSTRSSDKLHEAMTKTIEFRKTRRGIDRPLTKKTQEYHKDLLATAKGLLPDSPLPQLDDQTILSAIQDSGLGQSRRKAVFELVKGTLARAKENGAIGKNPLAGHIPAKVEPKERDLPTRAEIDAVFAELARQDKRYGRRTALAARLLAFSGLRISEAKSILWTDIKDGKIKLRDGEDIKTGKRELDINPPLQATLDDIASIYGTEGRVLPAKSVRIQLRQACMTLGIEPMTNHDLRSWFITWNITSGTDVGTLAKWCGNSAKVLLERYLSLQDEHRKLAASKLQ